MVTENPGRKLFAPEEAARFFGMDLLKYGDINLWLVSQLHPGGARCPVCSVVVPPERQEKFFMFGQIRCTCGKRFTARTGTPLDGSKLETREIYLLSVMTAWGVSVSIIAKTLACHVDTVTNWQSHFKAHQELANV